MTSEQIKAAKQLLFEGATQKYVAMRFGVSCETLQKYLRQREDEQNAGREAEKV